jgi:hypothetical protein
MYIMEPTDVAGRIRATPWLSTGRDAIPDDGA